MPELVLMLHIHLFTSPSTPKDTKFVFIVSANARKKYCPFNPEEYVSFDGNSCFLFYTYIYIYIKKERKKKLMMDKVEGNNSENALGEKKSTWRRPVAASETSQSCFFSPHTWAETGEEGRPSSSSSSAVPLRSDGSCRRRGASIISVQAAGSSVTSGSVCGENTEQNV